MEWKCRVGENEYTARDVPMLQSWARHGRITPDTYVFHPLLNKWIYARELEELRGVIDPNLQRCPFCGAYAVRRVEGLKGFEENAVGCFLVAFFLIPAIIYYMVKTQKLYCTNCNRRMAQ